MNNSSLHRPLWALVSALLLTASGLASAEPPSRAARLGFVGGTVSFSPAGQPDWVQASVNRPLTTGDRLWTDGSSRSELQIGGAAIRIGPSTSVVLLNLDDRITQLQLSQGALKIRVRSLAPGQTVEVATPNLAFTLNRLGEYRIEVDPVDDATAVMVESGEAEVYGENASYTVDSRLGYRFYGTDLSDYETVTAQRGDDLDRWSRERDRRIDNSVSARYVSTEVVGYEDLDADGTWRADPTYGNVWTPRRVAADWSPYRDGHWSWVDPWGWTWVDDAPWGYAVSHYGRWASINGSWAWVPGPRQERAVYAPALVAFVGGKNFQVSVSVGSTPSAAVGWFPLAPREVYQPSYPVGRDYFANINRSNAVIAPTTITNVYNTTIVKTNTNITNINNVTNITNVSYANQRVTGAVVAVPTQAFVQSQPVAKATVRLPPEAVGSAPIVRVANIAPVPLSVQGGAREATAKPPAREHSVVARTAPPPAPVPFASQQAQLAAKPGAPIDEAQRAQLKPTVPAATAPKVSVVATAAAPTPTALPPATPPAAKSPEARKAAAARADGERGDVHKPDAGKELVATPEAARGETGKATAAKPEGPSTTAARAAEAKTAETRPDAASAASAKARDVKAEESKPAAAQTEPAKEDTARAAATKAASASAEAAKAEASRANGARAATGGGDLTKDRAVKADAGKAPMATPAAEATEASKSTTTRSTEVKAEAAQAAAVRADSAKAAAAKAESAQAEAKKAEARARSEDARAEAGRADRSRAEAVKADQAKTEAAKVAAGKAGMDKAEAAKAAALAKRQDTAPPPKSRASDPKSDVGATPEDERKKAGRT